VKLPVSVVSKVSRPLLHLRKRSPQIMFAGGVAAAVTSTILACRATLRLSDTLAVTEELKEKAEAFYDRGTNKDYDEKTYHRDLTVIKVKAALSVTKLYAPSVGLGMMSVALLTGSHISLNRRNASLTAAYATVDQAFEKYRQRVVEQLGTNADRDFRYGTEQVQEVIEGEDGKKKTVKHTRVSSEAPSQYARFFDELCNDWKSNPEYNRAFLKCQQSYFNDMLKARGHVFLNEVYDALGMERSKAGAVVGWILSKDGDNFVDFGVFDDLSNPHVRDFVNGREHSILLDFNVDGVIYDKI
jgi:hypothetical protein